MPFVPRRDARAVSPALAPCLPRRFPALLPTLRPTLAAALLPALLAATLSHLLPPRLAAGPPMPPPAGPGELAARRARALEALRGDGGEKAVLVLRAPAPDVFSNDVDYPYRPHNDLFYLTGIDEPGCALLLSVEELEGLGREALFFTPAPEHLRFWVGERLGREGASRRSGIPERAVLAEAELAARLAKLVPRRGFHHHHGGRAAGPPRAIFFDADPGFEPGKALTEPYAYLLEALGSQAFHVALRRPGDVIHPLRQVKSPAEVALLEKAIGATLRAQLRAWQAARPGAHEYEVRAAIEAAFVREGCSGWSFPPIVGSGPSSCVPHYEGYGRRMEAGDLLVLDIGAEYGWYAADVTRTVPVGGRFTPRQRAVYDIVLRAQEAAIREVRPGAPWSRVHETAAREVARGLKALGLIREDSEAGKYFPHGASHGLGLDVHDPMPRGTLEPGMVITVEPGIYIREESLGVRIEDDVLVTEGGPRVLSGWLPREPAEVEEWMGAREW